MLGSCLLLAGCQTSDAGRRITLCRELLPALNPAARGYGQISATLAENKRDIMMVYVVNGASGARLAKTLTCRFGPAPQHELRGVIDDGDRMGPSTLYVLRKSWLETPDAALDDPARQRAGAAQPGAATSWRYFLQITLNGLVPAMVYGLLAATYSLIYGLIGRINLAFGALAVLGAATLFIVLAPVAYDAPAWIIPGVVAALLAAIGVGLIYGFVIARTVFVPMARASGQQVLVATLGLSLFLQEYLRLAQGTNPHWLPGLFGPALHLTAGGGLDLTITPTALLVMALAAVLGVALMVLMRVSAFGRAWRACADDNLAAAMFGISPAGILTRTLMLATALAALTGGLMAMNYGTLGYDGTVTLDLRALVAAVVGGIGSIPGAFVGGAVIALLESFWTGYFAGGYRDLMIDSVLVLVIMFRPAGLLGNRN
ncbi:MAG: branched-chain amino acid ABC transporter permease [Hyphomicrobiales bacterium]|nr:branched-chain amino acid ABC transporter permease [Hyphomicrobiales bacterium]